MSFINQKVGILGGGQLARMLCLEGFKLGLEMHVLSKSKDDPAAQVTAHWTEGDVNDPLALTDFFNKVDFVTIESEFLNEKTLLTAESHSSRHVTPSIRLISELSDRLKQKTWLERFKIPTSAFSGLITPNDAEKFYKKNKKTGVVFKKRRLGYDGFGTFIIKTPSELKTFLKNNGATINEYIVEVFQPFKRELAQTFTLSTKKDVLTFPLVEWQAEDAKCLWVKGPAKSANLKPLLKKMQTALTDSDYVGTIAFELFHTKTGLMVNEVAPRVHNSSHYTLEATTPNQFSAHLLAVVGERLPEQPTLTAPAFAMLNLLGKSSNPPKLKTPEGATLHWYGKKENRKGRKMGHVTSLSTTADKALREVLRLRKGFDL